MSKAIRATESSKRKKKMEKKKIDRRKFLKTFGVGAAAATAGLYGCKTKGTAPSAAAAGEVPTDRMTFRTCPSTGDRVSLLGYGCMRWPLLESPAADGNPIDQEAVNELVDYAIAHGVNYFDTAPVYIQGFSEKSTGIALKRHPREKVFIATKMSNHRMAGRGMSPARIFKDSEEMYRRSLRDLQTDYLDYYLLHAVGGVIGIHVPDVFCVLHTVIPLCCISLCPAGGCCRCICRGFSWRFLLCAAIIAHNSYLVNRQVDISFHGGRMVAFWRESGYDERTIT